MKKFQLNMSKHIDEKCGKLCISSILNSKRGIQPEVPQLPDAGLS